MINDPIVEEVRRSRDKLARQFNYDIHAIFADLLARQRKEDPAHQLVQDADEWAEASAMALNDKPPRKP